MALLDRLRWRLRMLRFALTVLPVAGGSPEGESEGGTEEEGEPTGAAEGEEEEEPTGGPEGEPDWKRESRKHERRAKNERKRAEDLQRQLDERASADQTDQEKAVEAARKEAREAALAESAQERRADRLEAAVTRHAARGVAVGDETLRFADAEDALLHLQKAIRDGAVDEDDIFDDDGRVQADSLAGALGSILESKPHLRAGAESGGRPTGTVDAGRGTAAGKLEDQSVDDHLNAIKKTK